MHTALNLALKLEKKKKEKTSGYLSMPLKPRLGYQQPGIEMCYLAKALKSEKADESRILGNLESAMRT